MQQKNKKGKLLSFGSGCKQISKVKIIALKQNLSTLKNHFYG